MAEMTFVILRLLGIIVNQEFLSEMIYVSTGQGPWSTLKSVWGGGGETQIYEKCRSQKVGGGGAEC